MDVSKNNSDVDKAIVIKDPVMLLIVLGLMAACIVGFFVGISKHNGVIPIVALVPVIPLFLAFKNLNRGVIIDVKNDIFSYPGGKAADEITDYINPSWLAQRCFLTREEIILSQISGISWEDEPRVNDGKISMKYRISFEGTFGSITIPFGSKGKRNQLYNVLCQVLEMGDPVVVR